MIKIKFSKIKRMSYVTPSLQKQPNKFSIGVHLFCHAWPKSISWLVKAHPVQCILFSCHVMVS